MPKESPACELTELKQSLERLAIAPATAAAVGAARAYVGMLLAGRALVLPCDMMAFGNGYVTANANRAMSWERFQSEKSRTKLYVEGPPPADAPRLHHATPVPRNHGAVTTRDSHLVVLARGGAAVLRPFTAFVNLGPRPAPREVMLRSAEDRAELRRRLQVLDRR